MCYFLSKLVPDWFWIRYLRNLLLRFSGVRVHVLDLYIKSPYYMDSPRNVTIGQDVFINAGSVFEGKGLISIGDNCQIGPYVVFSTTNHLFGKWDDQIKNVKISDNVWIGAHVTIVPGVAVGPDTIIGAGSVVTRDIGNGVFAGVPATLIKDVNYDHIELYAASEDKKASEYVKHINYLLAKHDLKMEGDIINLGCPVGAITNAVGKLNNKGKTYGLDVSGAAMEAAKRQYPGCDFCCESADNLDNFDNEYFDVIHARKFYPFTGTDDIHCHLEYLRKFHSKLKPYGFVIFHVIAEDKGFYDIYGASKQKISEIGYSGLERYTMVPQSIFRLLGGWSYNKLLYSFLLSILMKFKLRKLGYLYILTKK